MVSLQPPLPFSESLESQEAPTHIGSRRLSISRGLIAQQVGYKDQDQRTSLHGERIYKIHPIFTATLLGRYCKSPLDRRAH